MAPRGGRPLPEPYGTMIRPIATAVLTAFLMIPAAPAAAQLRADVSITPQAGALTPAEWFYYEVTAFGEGPMEWTEAAVLRSAVIGATAAVDFSRHGVEIRGTLLRTIDADTYVALGVMNAGPMTPSRVDRTRYWVPTDITLASIDIALATRLRLPLGAQPYILAGIGGKHYSFDRTALAEGEPGLVVPQDGTNLMINVGGGLAIPLSRRLALDVQVRDAMTEYWGSRQHDVAWMAGLSWRLGQL